MAVTAKLYGSALMKAFNDEINLANDTIRVMLCTSSYVPNQDTHIYKSSVTNEVVGDGYVARGIALTSKTLTYNASTNVITFDAADVQWSTANIVCRYAVIYCDTGTDSSSALIGYLDFGSDQVSTSGNFSIVWGTSGIFTFTIS